MNPLDQLADIKTPDAISWWPLAIGYWILLVVVVILIAILCVAVVKYRNRIEVRNSAISQIESLDEHSPTFRLSIQHILKLTIQHYLPSQKVVAWHSEQWKKLLTSGKSGTTQPELADTLFTLHESLYSTQAGDLPPATIKNAAIKWLKLELPSLKYDENSEELNSV